MLGEYLGLLECPSQRGYIEFTYHQGDRAGELERSLDAEWGSAHKYGGNLMNLRYGRWALFVQDAAGAYVRLPSSEAIPVAPPPVDGANLPEVPWDGLPGDHSVPVLDMAEYKHFKVRNFSDYDHLTKEEKFKLRFNFDRHYTISAEKAYAVKLLALVVVVGG